MDMDCQQNGDDGGVLAIATVYELCSGRNPTGLSWGSSRQMRNHLVHWFDSGVATVFPSAVNRLPDKVLKEQYIPIYCVCHQPEEKPMVQCKKGGEWFHQRCVQFARRVHSHKESYYMYVCMNC